ncbi:MAG: hypothetical protein ACIAXF_15545 [Phycisphaerales bacterium JB063]
MYIYAGIDEAGYGPMYGPMVVARSVLVIPALAHDAPPPQLWQRLSKVVCKQLRGAKGRIPINDSKKLKTKAAGVKHLESGVLAFAALGGHTPGDVADWLDLIGETRHRGGDGVRSLEALPWYTGSPDAPWGTVPTANTIDELAISKAMLATTCERIGVELGGFRARVFYEDELNYRLEQMRSKAAVSFMAVASHLDDLFRQYGEQHPHVSVDRQSGRTRYREPLAQAFDGAAVDILGETDTHSAYRITAGRRTMTITFQTQAEESHMPTALASMAAKLTRELLMQRFNAYFTALAPDVKPTAGYGTDANRWRDDMLPHLQRAGIDHARLRRRA